MFALQSKQKVMKQVTPHRIERYIRNNWFPLGIFIILSTSFYQKNISHEFLPAENANIALVSNSQVEESKAIKQTMGFSFPGTSKLNIKPVEANSIKKNISFEFLDRFEKVAAEEAAMFNIPSSVILGLGLYHANSTKSQLTSEVNNYFGLPCTRDWEGESINYNDACYREYESAWFSFRDNSKLLKRLKDNWLKSDDMPNPDLKDWATILKQSGLINDTKKYLDLVSRFNLVRFDS